MLIYLECVGIRLVCLSGLVVRNSQCDWFVITLLYCLLKRIFELGRLDLWNRFSYRSDQGSLTRAVHQFQLEYGNVELLKGESASLQRIWKEITASTVFQELLGSTNQVHRLEPVGLPRGLRSGSAGCTVVSQTDIFLSLSLLRPLGLRVVPPWTTSKGWEKELPCKQARGVKRHGSLSVFPSLWFEATQPQC